jgi:site-specific DNA recombinase
MNKKSTRAAFYGRYFTDMQREASIEDQFRNLEKRASAEGWKVVQRFADKGISGSRNDRPEYQRMLAAAKRKEFDVLLIEALNRFARNLVEQEQAIRRMEFDGIRIIGISDGYDSQQKGRKLNRAMRGAINEGYSEDLAEKTHRGHDHSRPRGRQDRAKANGQRIGGPLRAAQGRASACV